MSGAKPQQSGLASNNPYTPMADYTSNIKTILAPRPRVYARLSDLSGLSKVKELIPADKLGKIDIEAIDSDTCAFVIPMAGRLELKIVEREPDKTIKLEAQSAPIPLTIWIQLIEPEAGDTRLRLTLRTELNFMMKKMVGGKLQEGLERLADIMAALPY